MNDLTGKQFGNWKVLRRVEDYISPSGYHQTQYLCECQCENKTQKNVLAINLTRGKTLSCGCKLGENISNSLRKENTYDLTNEYGIGYTYDNHPFYFDIEDYETIKHYCWHLDKAGYLCANTHLEDGSKSTIKMHRLIMNMTNPSMQIDHINHHVNDNRKSNLRIVTARENAWNKRILDSNTSGRTGVYLNKRDNIWIAQIKCGDQLRVLGRFKNFEDAVIARKNAEDQLFGEYSYENSINR